MKYKVIHNDTETLCDKVIIDGFDYYVSDEEIVKGDYYVDYRSDGNRLEHFKEKEDWVLVCICGSKKVIATNNPSIDLPQVFDEVKEEAEVDWIYKEHGFEEGYNPQRCIDGAIQKPKFINGYIKGYNKSQETHPFSMEDMIDFATFRNGGDVKKEFELWQSQRTITIHAK